MRTDSLKSETVSGSVILSNIENDFETGSETIIGSELLSVPVSFGCCVECVVDFFCCGVSGTMTSSSWVDSKSGRKSEAPVSFCSCPLVEVLVDWCHGGVSGTISSLSCDNFRSYCHSPS